MKILRYQNGAVLAAILSCSLFSMHTLAACSSSGNNASYEWIDSIRVADHFNGSGISNGYEDYTSQVINLEAGTYAVSLTPGFSSGSYTEYWNIWIDLNQDDTLSSDELVFSGTSSGQVNGNITIPADSLGGETLMRISMKYSGTAPPCGTFTYGEVEDYTVNVSIDDLSPPTILSTIPEGSATDIAVNSMVNVVFSENIDPNSIDGSNFFVEREGIPVQGVTSISANTATFTPNALLEPSSIYLVNLAAGISDLNGNSIEESTSWSFTTKMADSTAPIVEFTSPDDQAVNVFNSFMLQAKFSEAMDPSSINETSFVVDDGVNNIAGTVSYSSGFAQFYPDVPYDYSTEHTATLTTEVMDLAGNPLAEVYSWSFTSDELMPNYCSSWANNYSIMWIDSVKLSGFTVSSQSVPVAGYSQHTSTIFNIGRDWANSIQLTPKFSGSAYTVYWRVFVDWNQDGVFSDDEIATETSGNGTVNGTFSVPDSALPGNARMRISMKYGSHASACENFSYGKVNDYRVNVPAVFSDTTAPSVVSITPANGTQLVATDTAISVFFSESMDPLTINDMTLTVDDGIDAVLGTTSYDPEQKRALFTPLGNLNYASNYNVIVYSAITDLAGNMLGNDVNGSFVTEPEPGPSFTIAGAVLQDGLAVSNVNLQVSGASTHTVSTDGLGNYSLDSVPQGSYVLTPSKSGFTFSPESINVGISDSDIVGLNFNAQIAIGILENGDFETGDLSGFESFIIAGGHVVEDVVNFDTNNDGQASLAAKFNVGRSSSSGDYEGGGIKQLINLKAGELNVSLDIASSANNANSSGGMVKIYLDGILMDSHDFGSISNNAKKYASLSFYEGNVSAGEHELKIEMTRPYATTSVACYLDDIVISGSSLGN